MAAKPKDKVRYAVVGMGYISQNAVLPGFGHATKNSVLGAIVSGDKTKRAALARKYRVPAYDYTDYDALLDSGRIDAVYIALPNNLHKEFVVRAARKGIHVLCEKPLGMTGAECDVMIQAAKRGNIRFMTAYRLHFEESNMAVVKALAAGQIGEPRFFSSTFSISVRDGNYRTDPKRGGGSLYDLGVYCINAARYLFRAEPIEVTAFTASNGEKRFRNIDEMAGAVLRFPQDRLAQFTTSFGAADTSAYDVVGTKGSVRMDPAYEYVGKRTMVLTRGEKKTQRVFAASDQFASELIYFSDCVRLGKDPEPSGQEGAIDVRIIEALYRSAKTGRPIRIAAGPKQKRPTTRQVIKRPAVPRPPRLVRTVPATA